MAQQLTKKNNCYWKIEQHERYVSKSTKTMRPGSVTHSLKIH